MKHIIFDLDGTIIDSKNEILKTYRLVFDRVPPATPVDTGSLNYGVNINDLLRGVYGSDSTTVAAAKKLFSSIYDSSDYRETNLYEGVVDTLNLLKESGHRLYIATNKRYAPTVRILEKKKIKHFFSYIIGYEMEQGVTLSKRQMVAELKRIGGFNDGYMVGDSTSDILAGNEEGLTSVAVTYGYENMDILALSKPKYIIHFFPEISNLPERNS